MGDNADVKEVVDSESRGVEFRRFGSARLARNGLSRPVRRRQDGLAGYMFTAPLVMGFAVVVVVPLVFIVLFSMRDFNIVAGTFDFIGLGNYAAMVEDTELRTVARNTLVFTMAYVPLNVGLGLATAVLVNQRTGPRKFLRMAFFVPVVLSLPSWTVVWKLILDRDGGLNAVLGVLGLGPFEWLRDAGLAMVSVVLVQTLKTFGLSMVFFLAALQQVPSELEEAAASDGASGGQIFRYVILPTITPFVFLVTVLTLISSFKSFALIFLMTGGGPGNATSLFSYYIYEQGFKLFEQGYGSALAVVLFIVVLVLTGAQFGMRKRWVHNEN